jgi:hypothetical protein
VANIELSTKLVLSQSNTVEAKFAQLKALVMNMVAQVKSQCIWVRESEGLKKHFIFQFRCQPKIFLWSLTSRVNGPY